MGDFTYVNGSVVPSGLAAVPVSDSGFLFGDGLFETLRVYGGRPFKLEDHLSRLEEGLAGLDIRNAPPQNDLLSAVLQTINANGEDDCVIRLTVTRGVEKPSVVVTTRPIGYTEKQYEDGVTCITAPETRGSLSVYKTLNYLPNRMAKLAAEKAGALEAIFVSDGGLITEGSMSSVFVLYEGVLRTPGLNCRILPGITRRTVLQLAAAAGVQIEETLVACEDLGQAQEVFITNSALEIMPVVAVDGKPVASGRPGELAGSLRARYKELA